MKAGPGAETLREWVWGLAQALGFHVSGLGTMLVSIEFTR